MLRRMLVIVLIALTASACSSSRQVAVSQSADLRINESTDVRSRDSVMVAVHDTIREITTITVDRNEVGDTVKVAQVTERDRIRDRAQVKNKEVEVRVVRDTVFVEKRDSVSATTNLANPTSRASPVTSALKWGFWIIVSLTVFIVVIKFLK